MRDSGEPLAVEPRTQEQAQQLLLMAPSQQTLVERIRHNAEVAQINSSGRRCVGTPLPTTAEIQAVYAAREACATQRQEEALQSDVHRRGAVAAHFYDSVMAAATAEDDFFDAAPLSDVEARRAVVRPIKKLFAIFAIRQRLENLLRILRSTSSDTLVDVGSAADSTTRESQLILPASSPLPNISTLLRGISLPDVAVFHGRDGSTQTKPSCVFAEAPRTRPCHEPFAFRLQRFTPVSMPEIVIDISAQAEKEVKRGDAEAAVITETDVVPALAPLQPSAGQSDAVLGASASRSLRRRAADSPSRPIIERTSAIIGTGVVSEPLSSSTV